ncbi:MAG TPA: hypothetical protein VM734_11130 [Kofleriaceae bacterium]|nr:hypothetical protein [Kofleriaceae bacterium]
MKLRILQSVALVVIAACRTAPAPTPVPAAPWQQLAVPGAPAPLIAYPDPIERYAPADRGAYVVRIAGASGEPADDEARRALVASLGAGDDILGEDGYIVRLSAAARDALATRPGVASVAILQPSDRRSMVLLADRSDELPEVRIDLFADATADEVAAVAAWVDWRGGRVLWRGRAALRARVPREAFEEASRLSPVRWIE